ncbi:hypothetical protein L3Q82_001311 [Scortum barcoo]|uniref:Uncharacterized protein n=1 Tax=Scortum barcoo TaxID=214431 RepID=A0ACB8W6Q4_9TELE|nr:hypothetical protein L3Q82_001311 [Scortum barcoo]
MSGRPQMTLPPLCDLGAFLVLSHFSLLINPSPSRCGFDAADGLSCPDSVTKEALKVGYSHCDGDYKGFGEPQRTQSSRHQCRHGASLWCHDFCTPTAPVTHPPVPTVSFAIASSVHPLVHLQLNLLGARLLSFGRRESGLNTLLEGHCGATVTHNLISGSRFRKASNWESLMKCLVITKGETESEPLADQRLQGFHTPVDSLKQKGYSISFQRTALFDRVPPVDIATERIVAKHSQSIINVQQHKISTSHSWKGRSMLREVFLLLQMRLWLTEDSGEEQKGTEIYHREQYTSGAQRLNQIKLSFNEHKEVQKTGRGRKEASSGRLWVLRRRLERLGGESYSSPPSFVLARLHEIKLSLTPPFFIHPPLNHPLPILFLTLPPPSINQPLSSLLGNLFPNMLIQGQVLPLTLAPYRPSYTLHPLPKHTTCALRSSSAALGVRGRPRPLPALSVPLQMGGKRERDEALQATSSEFTRRCAVKEALFAQPLSFSVNIVGCGEAGTWQEEGGRMDHQSGVRASPQGSRRRTQGLMGR